MQNTGTVSRSIASRSFSSKLASRSSAKPAVSLSSVLLGVACGCMIMPAARAGNDTWSASPTSAAWSLNGNWGTAAPGNTTTGVTPTTDVATFNTAISGGFGNSTTPIVIDSGRTLFGLTFGSSAGAYVIGATGLNTLNLSSGGTIQTTGGTGSSAEVVNAPLALFGAGATYTFTSGYTTAANTLTFGGAISGGTAGATVLTLNGANTGANAVSGIISNGTSTSVAVTKSGTGAWTLSGANTFTGGVTLSQGTLNINNATALGNSAGTFSIGSGTTINSSAAAVTMTQNNPQTWNGSFTFTGTNNLTFGAGAITMTANTTVTASANTLTENGAIGGGAFTLTKAGAGTLVLTGANTYTGGTTVSAGTLSLGNGGTTGSLSTTGAIVDNGTLTINRSNAVVQGTDFSAAAITGTGAFIQAGSGTTTLVAANTYTGTTTVSGGTLKLDFSAGGAPATNIINTTTNSSALTLSGGTLNIVGAASGTSTQRFNGLTINAGNSAITLTAGAAVPTVTLGGSGAFSRATGGTINFAYASGTPLSTTATTNVTNGVWTQASGTPTAFATVNGTDWATVTAGTISALGSYSAGSANYLTANNVDVANGDAPASGVTVNSLRFNAATDALTLAGTNAVGTGGILVTSTATAASITGGTLQSGTGKEMVVINNGTLTVGSVIADSGSGASSLTLSGAGTTTLTGASTYTGGTRINAGGTLQLGNGSTTGALSTTGGITNNGNLTFNRSNAVTEGADFSGAGISGVGSLTKTGSGALTLNVANTYSGGTTLTTGTLNINNASALGAGALTIGSGTTIDNSTAAAITMSTNNAQTWNGNYTFTGTQSLTFGTGAVTLGANTTVTASANTLTEGGAIGGGSFTLTKAGAGTLALNGNNTYNGLTTVSAGTLTLAGNNAGSGGVTLTAGTLNINNAGALGTGTLTITAGTINNSSAADITTSTNNNAQAWNGNFAYSATKALNLGTGAVTLGASPTVTVNGTGLNGAGALTVGGIISGTGRNLTKAGVGTLILSGANTYDSGTTITGGVLQFNSTGAIAGSGNNVTVNPLGSASGATAAFGYALDQATLTGRIVAGSRGTVALAADSSNNLDFNATGLTKLSLGASTGTWAYSGTLWTPGDGVYRLGGGGGTLTFNPTLTSGSLLVGGGGSGGTVTLVNAGTYSGGTTVTGGMGGSTIGATGGASLLQSNVLTGTSNTPFGSNAAITLNNGALGLGTAGTLASGNVMNVTGYDVTYSGQNTIKLAVGSGSSVTLAANTLNRANNGVLLLTPTAGANLGSTEKVTVASGAPTVTNGMVAPYYVDGTTRNFVTYGANGFQDITYSVTGTTDTDIANASANSTVVISNSTFNTSLGGNKAIYALKLVNTNNTFNANAIGVSGETLTLLSGGLIIDTTAGGGINFSSDTTRASINFGTAEAVVGIFGSNAAMGTSPWLGTGGLTLYGTGSYQASNVAITGGVTIAGATVRLGGSNGINTNNQLTIGRAGTFQFIAGNTQQVLGLSGEGLVNTSSSTPTLIVDGLTGTGTTTFSGTIQNGSGTVAFTKSGSNTQVFSGTNTYGGATTVSNGILRLDFSAASAPSSNIINNQTNTSALVLSGGKLDIVGAAGATNSQQFNGLTVGAGNSSISTSSGTGGTTNVTLGSTLTRNVGGTINFDLPASGGVSTTATTFAGNGVLVSTSATGPAFATVNGTDWAKVTSGTIGALASYDTNDFSASTKNTDVTSNQGPAAFTVNTLRFNTAGTTLTLTGNNIIGTGGILVTSATSGAGNGVIITGGTNIKSSAGNEMVIINNGQLTVSSVIADGAAASALTLSGSGTTTLNAANTFTGSAYINSGTVVVGNAAAFGTTAGTLNLNGGTLQSGSTVVLNAKAISLNRNFTIGGSNNLTLSGVFTNTSSSNTLTINNTAATSLTGGVVLSSTLNVAGSGDLTASGVISSTGSLVYAGTGTMTLSNAASTYTGVTKVSGGTLSVGTLAAGASNSSIGASSNAASNVVLDGGTLKYTGATVSTDRLFSVGGSGGTLDASGTGVLTLSNAGSISFNNTPGTRTLTLTGTNTGANTLTPIVSDFLGLYATSLTKSGAGKWVLAGANTYTGATTVTNGTLSEGSTGSIADTSALTVNGASAIFDLGASHNDTVAAVTLDGGGSITGSGTSTLTSTSGFAMKSGSASVILDGAGIALTKTTSGTVTLTGANTYTGGANLNGGTLALGSAGAIGSTGTISFGGGSLQYGASNTTDYSARFSTAAGQAYSVDTNGQSVTMASALTSVGGSLAKTGGGTLTLSNANTYDGGTTISGGTLSVSGSLADTGAVTVGGGTYDVAASDTVGAVTLTSGTISGAGTLSGASYGVESGTISAVLGGSGALTKSTAGTVALNSASTYSGNTTIAAGTLALGSSGSFASTPVINLGSTGTHGTLDITSKTSGFTLGAGQTLAGYGTVNIGGPGHVLTIDGTLAPGNSPGIVTVTGDLTLGAASTTNMEIVGRNGGAPVAGTDFDRVIISGAVVFGGTLNINTTGLSGLADGDTFNLFAAGGTYTAGFTSVVMTGAYEPTFTGSAGVWTGSNGGFDFTFTEATGSLSIMVAAIPEPATYAAIFGALALAGVACRRRGARG